VGEDLRKIVEEAFQLPLDQLKDNLLPLLNGIKEFGVARLMELVPDLVPRLVGRLREIDVTRFTRENPEISAKFMDILWEGISVLVEKNPDVKEALERAGEVSVNLEALDSPMKGHFRISGGKLSGGSGLLDKADLSIKGYTQAMIEVLLGDRDPTEAFFKQLIKTDGNIVHLLAHLLVRQPAVVLHVSPGAVVALLHHDLQLLPGQVEGPDLTPAPVHGGEVAGAEGLHRWVQEEGEPGGLLQGGELPRLPVQPGLALQQLQELLAGRGLQVLPQVDGLQGGRNHPGQHEGRDYPLQWG
jgi:hypothetical protein